MPVLRHRADGVFQDQEPAAFRRRHLERLRDFAPGPAFEPRAVGANQRLAEEGSRSNAVRAAESFEARGSDLVVRDARGEMKFRSLHALTGVSTDDVRGGLETSHVSRRVEMRTDERAVRGFGHRYE